MRLGELPPAPTMFSFPPLDTVPRSPPGFPPPHSGGTILSIPRPDTGAVRASVPRLSGHASGVESPGKLATSPPVGTGGAPPDAINRLPGGFY
jgi:hypothetical protein